MPANEPASSLDAFDNPKRLRSCIDFLARPNRFKMLAGEHDLAMSCKADDLRRIYLSDRERHLRDFEERARLRATEIRRDFWIVGFSIFATLLIAFTSAAVGSIWLGKMPTQLNLFLQAVGAALLLWGTVWQLDPYTKSMAGALLAERVQGWLFRALYYLGTTFITVAYFWPTA